MKQEENCTVWSWSYFGFAPSGGKLLIITESIFMPMWPPLKSLGKGVWDLKTHSPSIISSCDDRRVLQRPQVGLITKSLVKSSIKNHLKDATDVPVNPTKYPCIWTESTMPVSKESCTISSLFYYIPARSPPHFSLQSSSGFGQNNGPGIPSARTISRSKRHRASQVTADFHPQFWEFTSNLAGKLFWRSEIKRS